MIPEAPPDLSAVPAGHRDLERRRRWRIVLATTGTALVLGAGLAALVAQPLLTRPRPVAPVPVDPARLEREVRFLAVDCYPRDWRHGENLEKAAGHLAEAFRTAAGRVSRQAFQVRGRTFENVIASFGPVAGPRVVVGAHYDACGVQPGADDNASGVACLVALAEALGRSAPRERVDLVAYTLEEPPFFRTSDMGSARHAQRLKEEGAAVTAVIVLEMVGRFTDAPDSQRYPLPFLDLLYPDRGNFIAVAGRFADIGLTRDVKAALRSASPLPVVSLSGPRWVPGLDFSDHHPYWDRGFRAVMVTDTAFYRNRDYHLPTDTPEKLDCARMAQVVQGVAEAVTRLANPSH